MINFVCCIKTITLLSMLLRTSIYSGAVTVNSTPSKFITTLRGTVTPDTTPASSATNPQTLSSLINTDFRMLQTTRPPTSLSTAEPSTSTMAIASSTVTTTTTHQPQPPAHRIPSRLEEKLESLSCDIPPLPTESRLWRGNETHELMLPITVSKPKLYYPSIYSGIEVVNTGFGSHAASAKFVWVTSSGLKHVQMYFSTLVIRVERTRKCMVRFKIPIESTMQVLKAIMCLTCHLKES